MQASRLKYALSMNAWNGLAYRSMRKLDIRVRKIVGTIPQAALSAPSDLPEDIRGRLRDLSSRERRRPSFLAEATAYGGEFQKERLRAAAEYCVSAFPGDLVEIGCYIGETTLVLAEVAAAAGRRVIAVDPWETGTQNCSGWEYEQFVRNTAAFAGCIRVVRMSSLDKEAIRFLRQQTVCMAFVDGLHTYDAALSDIRAVSHCTGVIAIDDVGNSSEVMTAMRHAAYELSLNAVHLAAAKEGYLVRNCAGVCQTDGASR